MSRRLYQTEDLEELARKVGYRVGELAKKLGRSERTLERDFDRQFGKTPREWLDELWRADALACLTEEGNVANAAAEMGYKHWHHFSRNFKRVSGMSPSQVLKSPPPSRVTRNRRLLQKMRDPVKPDLNSLTRLPSEWVSRFGMRMSRFGR